MRQKLNAMSVEFKGKNVLLVDDSIVRGTTSREIVQMAREAGANKVFFASAAPPIRFPNVYGIDMPTRDELIAHGRSDEEIRFAIGADALIYQSIESMKRAVAEAGPRVQPVRGLLLRRPLRHRRHHPRVPRPDRERPAASAARREDRGPQPDEPASSPPSRIEPGRPRIADGSTVTDRP